MIRRNSFKAGSQQITIRLLDDNEVIQVDFQSHHKGQFLMDYVCRQLNIAEKDYFGLRYVDSNKQRHWLELGKSILKQLKEMTPYIVCVRFKFYPCDPMLLKEEVSRYQLVLQLRRDILHGRLYSTISDMAILASYIIQSELGDYDPERHRGNYVAEFELVSRQSGELEEKVIELHQKLKGVTPSESDMLFLKKAAQLDTYGVDPHPVKDQQGEQVYLGINHTGISTFEGSKKSTHFKWSQITKLNYEAKMFIVHLSIAEDSRTKKKETVGYKCQTSSSCKYLWRCAVEQRLFFNCGCTNDVPASVRGGGIFGSRFRYSGRVQREILEDPGPLRASDLTIQRTPLYRSLQRNKTRSLPHSPLQLGYGSLPRSNHSAPPHESTRLDGALGTLGSSTSLPLSTLSSPYCPDHQLPLLETLQEDSPREDKEVEKVNTQDAESALNAESAAFVSAISTSLDETSNESELTVVTTPDFEKTTSLLSPTEPLVSIEEETESGTGSEAEDDKYHKLPNGEIEISLDAVAPGPRRPLTRATAIRELSLTNDQDPSSVLEEPIPSAPFRKVGVIELERSGQVKFGRAKSEGVELGKLQSSDGRPKSMGASPNAVGLSLVTNVDAFDTTEPDQKSLEIDKPESETIRLSTDLPNGSFNMKPDSGPKEDFHVGILKTELNHVDSNANTVLKLIGATTPPALVTPSSRDPITLKTAFPNYQQEQEDGYEVVPNDSEHLLRESRIDQIGSQVPTPVEPNPPIISISTTPLQGQKQKTSPAYLSIGKIFIICLLCVLTALVVVSILAIEVDIDICRRMRKIPEVEMFQNELYGPIKNFVLSKFPSSIK